MHRKERIDYKEMVEVFYKWQFRLIGFFGLWPAQKAWSKFWQILYQIYFWHFLLIWMISLDLSMIFQLFTHIASITEVIKVLFILATALGVMGKFLSIKINNQKFIELFQLMHSSDLLPANHDEEMIFRKTMNMSRMVLSLLAWNLVMLTQYVVDNTELPISLYSPFQIDTMWKYTLLYIYQYMTASILCYTNISFDSMSGSFFIYLKGLLEILENRLKVMGKNERDTQEYIHEELKNCIRFYTKIVQIANRMEYLVSIPVSVQILCSVFVLIANFYAMSFLSGVNNQAEFVKYLVYQICMLAQIFIICFYANEVSMKSLDLSHALYSSNWIHWDKRNRRLILLMMFRFSSPIRIRTINACYSFNLAVFTSFIQSILTVIVVSRDPYDQTPFEMFRMIRLIIVRILEGFGSLILNLMLFFLPNFNIFLQIVNSSYSYFALLKKING